MKAFLKSVTTLLVAVVATLLASLATAANTRDFTGGYDDVWNATTQVMAKYRIPANYKKDDGVISTDWVVMQDSLFPFRVGLRAKAVLVVKTQGAGTRITSTLTWQQKESNMDFWHSTKANQREKEFSTLFFSEIEKSLREK